MLSNTFYLSAQLPNTTHPHSSRMVVTMRKTKVRTWHVAYYEEEEGEEPRRREGVLG